MAERAHPDDPAFQGTIYERKLRERYAACCPRLQRKRVLDVPCGTGWGASLLHGYQSLTAMDLDFASVEYGLRNFPGINFVAASMTALPFASSAFDSVLCLEGIEHIFRSDVSLFLSEAARVLSPDGELLVTVPLLNEGRHSGNPFHMYEFAEDEVQGLLERWFEPVEAEINQGGGGPVLWFVGKRRSAPMERVVTNLSAASAIRASAKWLDSVHVDNGFAYARGGQKTLISTCLGILILESTQALGAVRLEERTAWIDDIQSCQQAGTGLFHDPVVGNGPPSPTHDSQYQIWVTTYFALQALDALGAAAREPLAFTEQFYEDGAVESWLQGLNWGNAWLESNRIMYLLNAIVYRVECEGRAHESSVLHRVLDWLDRKQDPETGLWGAGQGSSILNAVAGAYHFIPFYEYVRRPVRSVTRIIDATLSLQKSDGLFGPDVGGGACEDLDAVDILTTLSKYANHRSLEVRCAAVRAYWAVWNMQNSDGSFPYTGRQTNEAYAYGGWPALTAGLNAGDVWSTWFRGLLLATVSAAFPADVPPCDWRFRRWPALGYHRQDHNITAQERTTLPSWIRTIQAAEPSGARVSVVITCYNLGRYLYEALASVTAQTLKPVKIILVDDGSSDEFTQLLLDGEYYRGIELIRQPNRGVAAARNTAIRAASTEYLCCLDADDIVHPQYLAKAVAVLDLHPGAAFVSCFYELFDCGSGVYRYTNSRLPEMLVRNEAVGISVFRKCAWEAAGGCSEQLSGMQDWDLWIGMLENGFTAEVLPEVLFSYRTRPGSMYSVTSQPVNYERNCRQIAQRHSRAYSTHLAEVMALKGRQFIELVNLRSQEQEYWHGQERLIADYKAHTATLEEAKQWLLGQVGNWRRLAEERDAALVSLRQEWMSAQQRNSDLNLQVATWRASHDGLGRQLQEARNALELQTAQSKRTIEQLTQQLADERAASSRNEQILDSVRVLIEVKKAWAEETERRIGRLTEEINELREMLYGMRRRPKGYLSRAVRTVLLAASPVNARAKRRNLSLWWRVLVNAEKRKLWNQLFDSFWYAKVHRDVYAAGLNPTLHYILCGHLEGRAASPEFNGPLYLERHTDVKAQEINPLLHYVVFGINEHRLPSVANHTARPRPPDATGRP